jgi:hypothetical protein
LNFSVCYSWEMALNVGLITLATTAEGHKWAASLLRIYSQGMSPCCLLCRKLRPSVVLDVGAQRKICAVMEDQTSVLQFVSSHNTDCDILFIYKIFILHANINNFCMYNRAIVCLNSKLLLCNTKKIKLHTSSFYLPSHQHWQHNI